MIWVQFPFYAMSTGRLQKLYLFASRYHGLVRLRILRYILRLKTLNKLSNNKQITRRIKTQIKYGQQA